MRVEIVFAQGMGYGDGSYTAKTPFHAIINGYKNALDRTIYDEWLLEAATMIKDRLEKRFLAQQNPDGTKWEPGPNSGWRAKDRRSSGILFRSGKMAESLILDKIQRTSISITNSARSNHSAKYKKFDYPATLKRLHPDWNWWQPADLDIDDAAKLMMKKIVTNLGSATVPRG